MRGEVSLNKVRNFVPTLRIPLIVPVCAAALLASCQRPSKQVQAAPAPAFASQPVAARELTIKQLKKLILPVEKAANAGEASRELSALVQETVLRLEANPDQVALPAIIHCYRQETFEDDESLVCVMLDAVGRLPAGLVVNLEVAGRSLMWNWPLREDHYGEKLLNSSCLRFVPMMVWFRDVDSPQVRALPDGTRYLTAPVAWKSSEWTIKLNPDTAPMRVIRVPAPLVEE